ncbi:MAG: DNA-3-methyladenine glycosylase 2 family protein [Ferruginibacter sp.]|nr:DNA-3-methyladenine glycosylase 2 family protein [Cytophagales bacterium]
MPAAHPHHLHLAQDAYLKPLLEGIELPAFVADRPVYPALLESIISQQLSVRVADVIHGRFLALFNDGLPHPDQLLALPTEALRSVGLSSQKANYLRNAAEFALTRGLEPERIHAMTDDEVVAYLTQIKGVGRWTAEMILMFVLNRPDVFPVDDLVIRQAMVRLYGVEAQGRSLRLRLTEIAQQWKPYRTYACQYLWRWKDTV